MSGISLSERQFLRLLGLGMWGEPTNSSSHDWLKAADWDDLQRIAETQTVLGHCFDALTLLPAEVRPPRIKQLEWWIYAKNLSWEYRETIELLSVIIEKFATVDLSPILLKGLGLAQYYQHPTHRQIGDIDLYFKPDKFRTAIQEIEGWENTVFEQETVTHRSYRIGNRIVEIHSQYQLFYDRGQVRRWQKFCERVPLYESESCALSEGNKVLVPQPQHNVIYIFMHAMHHLMQAGVGMRQICDWLNLWIAKEEEIDKDLFLQCAKQMRVARAMTAVTYIAEKYMGFKKGVIPLDITTRQAQEDGDFLLSDILSQGNFGNNSNIRRGMKRNSHWHNRWNYWHQIVRLCKMYRFAPQEAKAYPVYWLFSKF